MKHLNIEFGTPTRRANTEYYVSKDIALLTSTDEPVDITGRTDSMESIIEAIKAKKPFKVDNAICEYQHPHKNISISYHDRYVWRGMIVTVELVEELC